MIEIILIKLLVVLWLLSPFIIFKIFDYFDIIYPKRYTDKIRQYLKLVSLHFVYVCKNDSCTTVN